jgi:hypothetical protein
MDRYLQEDNSLADRLLQDTDAGAVFGRLSELQGQIDAFGSILSAR